MITGDTTGTLLTDDQLLTVRERPATADVTLHPNPAENLLIIESSSPQSMDWRIVSMWGQHLLSGRLDPNIERIINVSTLPAGNYLIQLSTAKGVERQQLIIAR